MKLLLQLREKNVLVFSELRHKNTHLQFWRHLRRDRGFDPNELAYWILMS